MIQLSRWRKYINREILVDEIIGELDSEEIQNQCFMLSGTRGSVKTVTMTSIEKIKAEDENWIIVRLNPTKDMTEGLVAKLYDTGDFFSKFIDKNLNLSKFGIGISVSSIKPTADIESSLEKILYEIT